MTTRAVVVALATGSFISGAAAFSIGAAPATPEPLSFDRPAYEVALRHVAERRDEALAHCDPALATAQLESCRTEASVRELVATAELQHAYRRTEQSARALQRARIDARYQLARARCGTMAGGPRDSCLVKVHAERGLALLQAAAPYDVRM